MSQIPVEKLQKILIEAQQAASTGRNWVQVYQAILDTLATTETIYPDGVTPAIVTTPNDDVDRAVLTWINGAAGVNADTGAFATYIRSYTSSQYQLRAGQPIPDGALQDASNQIASNFAWQFLFGKAPEGDEFSRWAGPLPAFNAFAPDLHTIGGIDAAGAASRIFKGNATSTTFNNFSPWAGTVLFTNLGNASFFDSWILDMKSNVKKIESGTYDLVAAAEATVQTKTVAGSLSLLVSGELGTLLGLQVTNAGVISSATARAQNFFEKAYGSDLSSIRIGSAIFGDLTGLSTLNDTYQIGTVRDETTNLRSNTDVLNTGAGNDTVNVDVLGQGRLRKGTVVIDGDAGTNTLSYANGGVPLTVTLQNEGYWHLRYKVELGSIGVTDYAYNFEDLKLSGNGDKVQWGSNFAPSNMDSAAALTIEEHPAAPSALNTVDFSQAKGSYTYDNGVVATSPFTFSGFSTLIGSSGGNDIFNILPSSGDSSFSRYVGGNSNNTFNVNYSSSSAAPLLLMGNAQGGDTFNFTNTNHASFTVVWGGLGNNNYNIRADSSANTAIIELDMAGVTAADLQKLDITKLETYVDSHYAVDFTAMNGPYTLGAAPEVVILNPTATDTITYNGTQVVSPQLALTADWHADTGATYSYSNFPSVHETNYTDDKVYALVQPGLAPVIYQMPIYSTAYPTDGNG
jgi:hypothetical protein